MTIRKCFGILLVVSLLLLSACSSDSTDTAGSESLSEPGLIENSTSGDMVKLTDDFRIIATTTKDGDTKDILEFLAYSKDQIEQIFKEKADKETSEMLKKANKLLKDAGKEVRQISHNMMPGVLSKFGLREAIEDLFEDVEEASDIQVEYSPV